MRLPKKVALITGGASGIGRAAARLFAQEGAKVVVSDWKRQPGEETVALIRKACGEAQFVEADVSHAPDVRAMIDYAIGRHGQLDILYNNAGVGYSTPGIAGTVMDITEERWDLAISVNLKSVYLCCKYAVPEMINSGGGSIINTSSAMAIRGIPNADAYTAAKGGVISLSRSLARELGQFGIRVNVICPGAIETPMIAEILKNSKERAQRETATPLGRIGRPEEVAYTALFLASDESSYITGAVLMVDGGRAII